MWVNVALVAWSLHGTWDSSANCFACLLGPREECEVLRWEYLCWSVCLSVCSHISKTTCPDFTKFSLLVTRGRGSILWQQCNTLSTSGFVDDVKLWLSRSNTDTDSECAT